MLFHNKNNFDCTKPRNSHSINDSNEDIQNILHKNIVWHGRAREGCARKRTSVQTIATESRTELAVVDYRVFVIYTSARQLYIKMQRCQQHLFNNGGLSTGAQLVFIRTLQKYNYLYYPVISVSVCGYVFKSKINFQTHYCTYTENMNGLFVKGTYMGVNPANCAGRSYQGGWSPLFVQFAHVNRNRRRKCWRLQLFVFLHFQRLDDKTKNYFIIINM